MRQFTWQQRLRYWFDNTMAKGTIALIAWLAAASALLILVVSVFAVFFAPDVGEGDKAEPMGFSEVLWRSMLRALDPGTMGGDDGSMMYLLAMLVVTLGGLFTVSTLIGVLTTGVGAKLEQLRKGRSLVVENNHTVILGWSEQVFTIVSELVEANANQKRPCIAIMAPRDKVAMEEAIRDKVGATRNTRVVCRSGSPIDLTDLEIVNHQGARSIIVLAPEGPEPDIEVIKTILALTNNPRRRKEPYHIVAAIANHKNMEAARLVGGAEVELVETRDVIARVTAQTCRQSGLSIVYNELLDFGGDEIYFKEEPDLVGRTLGEALLAYADSCVIGVQFADGRVALKPPLDTVIAAGDKIIAISEDDDTVQPSGLPSYPIDTAAIQTGAAPPAQPERTLVLGWNQRAPVIVRELDNYVAPNSFVTVVADHPTAQEDVAALTLKNQKVIVQHGDITERATLDKLQIGRFHHVIVLSYSEQLDVQRADAKTLVTLMQLRDIMARTGVKFSIVSEMLDVRNRQLAEVTQADDFIVSEKLISLQLTQISENKHLNAIFTDMFDPEGAEIYLKPAEMYVRLDQPLTFYTVVEAARRRGHIAIGYRLIALSGQADQAYGVVVNPDKGEAIAFAQGDKVIVIAED